MADGREDDREATFQFIEEVQNCPDLWDVSSAAYKDTKNKPKKKEELAEKRLRLYSFVQIFLFLQRFLFLSPAINIK